MTKTINFKDLPAPKGKPIFGNLKEFAANEKHTVLEKWVNEVGSVLRISLAGKKFMVSGNADLNNEILKSRPDKFRRFYKINEILEEVGIIGVFNAEGDQWKHHRKLTSEALNLKNVQGFLPTLHKVTERLMQRWANKNGEIVDIQKEMMRYTVDITTNIAFGYDINTLEKDGDVIQNHLEKIFPMINKRITSPIPLWRLIKSKDDKEFENALVEIEAFVQRFIDEAKERPTNHPELKQNPTNFLEALLVEQEKEGGLSDKEVFGNVFTILLAGEDTTSNSISWIIYYLCQNEKVVEKLRKEIQEVLGEDSLPSTNEQLTALKYTEAVAMEVMRLKPVTPNLYLQALEDVTIQNYEIKKGMTVMMQNKVPQTHNEHFSEPDAFIPDRWIPNGCPHLQNHSPQTIKVFGAGPRFCPGRNLAFHEMKMAIAMLLKNFDFTLEVDPKDVKEVFAFTMYPDNLKVSIKKRD
ncbi:cytochrome P450 [Fulvivirga sp.]|uniref:cytochrome P450 n=1 Tax=Fulvivirga sp. TaxID=1931237 RepID=UPI0032EC4BA8